jgi:hypothetical protein
MRLQHGWKSAVVLIVGLLGCGSEGDASEGSEEGAVRTARDALTTMTCAPDLKDVAFVERKRGTFRFHFLPGTAAERELDEISTHREDARARIAQTLQIEDAHVIDVFLSPSRGAAKVHGRSFGTTFMREARIEVIYPDDPESYEHKRWGHELTHAIEAILDDSPGNHPNLVDEGLAEYFDQSERDLHLAFAQEIRSSDRSLDEAIRMDAREIDDVKYGKAGSFVRRLFESNRDPERFKAFYRAVGMVWRNGAWKSRSGAALDTAGYELLLDGALRAHYDVDLATFTAQWHDTVAPYLERPATSVSAEDAAAIKALFAGRDHAVTTGNASAYRATMEGFYCDQWSDAARMREAERQANGDRVTTFVEEIVDNGLINLPTALVRVREERAGHVETRWSTVEHYGVGWRVKD